MCSLSEINIQVLNRLFNPFEFLSWENFLKQFRYCEASLAPLRVTFIFIPPCDPLFFFKVIIIFFIFDLSLFFPDPDSMVSGNAIIVPRAFKESTLEKGERETETN